jgi:hypothetical protein
MFTMGPKTQRKLSFSQQDYWKKYTSGSVPPVSLLKKTFRWMADGALWPTGRDPSQSTCNGSGDQNITTENNSFFFGFPGPPPVDSDIWGCQSNVPWGQRVLPKKKSCHLLYLKKMSGFPGLFPVDSDIWGCQSTCHGSSGYCQTKKNYSLFLLFVHSYRHLKKISF